MEKVVNADAVVFTAVIAQGASLSGPIDLQFLRLAGIQMPAAWDVAALTFQGSFDGITYFNVYDSGGAEYTVQAAASRTIIAPHVDFIGLRYLKIRSGTNGAAVNQTAARSLLLNAQ